MPIPSSERNLNLESTSILFDLHFRAFCEFSTNSISRNSIKELMTSSTDLNFSSLPIFSRQKTVSEAGREKTLLSPKCQNYAKNKSNRRSTTLGSALR